MKFFLLILKNLRRNKVRTALTALATMVLVFVVTMIWTIVYFLDNFTKEKSGTRRAVVTERFKMTGLEYTGIDLEFEIVGVLPEGRWDENGFMNARYLNNAIDAFKGPGGAKHPLDQRRLNFFWVEAGRADDFGPMVEQINTSPLFSERPVKCETFASLLNNFMDSYSGFIWFIQWVLVPGSMLSMVLLIGNAISLNVRERTEELAVLKVLGFRPWQLVVLVLGEALLLGACSGLL